MRREKRMSWKLTSFFTFSSEFSMGKQSSPTWHRASWTIDFYSYSTYSASQIALEGTRILKLFRLLHSVWVVFTKRKLTILCRLLGEFPFFVLFTRQLGFLCTGILYENVLVCNKLFSIFFYLIHLRRHSFPKISLIWFERYTQMQEVLTHPDFFDVMTK